MDKQTDRSDLANVTWRKSVYSNPSGNCVEVAVRGESIVIDGHIHVRDSKHPQGSVLSFTKLEWKAFVAGMKDGEFDLS